MIGEKRWKLINHFDFLIHFKKIAESVFSMLVFQKKIGVNSGPFIHNRKMKLYNFDNFSSDSK